MKTLAFALLLISSSAFCFDTERDVEIVSSQLPDQVMVIFEMGDHIVDVIDECMSDEPHLGSVIRGGQKDFINFKVSGAEDLFDARITIFDRGYDCDDEEHFFEGDVQPIVERIPGKTTKMVYKLNN